MKEVALPKSFRFGYKQKEWFFTDATPKIWELIAVNLLVQFNDLDTHTNQYISCKN